MARWFKINARMELREDLEQAERLNLPKPVITTVFNPMMIDLDSVIAYCHDYDSEGNASKKKTEITLSFGGVMVVEMGFNEFDKLIRDI